ITTAIPSTSPSGAALFVWGVWLATTVAALGLIATHGCNVLRVDEWELVPFLSGTSPVTFASLWEQHNDHRIPVPKLVLLALYRAAGDDRRLAMYANAAALAVLALALVWAVGRARGRTAVTDAFFPLALLHWGHCDSLLWAWQISFLIPTVLVGVLFLLLLPGTGHAPRLTPSFLPPPCLPLLPLCGAVALPYVCLLGAWFGWFGLRACLS